MAANRAGKGTSATSEGLAKDPQVELPLKPRSLEVSRAGINTADDFIDLMKALVGDLLEGSVTYTVGNAVSRACTNMLKAVELRQRYGASQPSGAQKVLPLTGR